MSKILIILLLFLISPLGVSAQADCPFGQVNEPAPGTCVRYLDANGDALCDLSETEAKESLPTGGYDTLAPNEYMSEEVIKQYTVKELAGIYNIEENVFIDELRSITGSEIKPDDTFQYLHDTYGLCSGVAGSVAITLKNESTGNPISTDSPEELVSGQELKTMNVSAIAQLYGISSVDYAKALAKGLGATVKTTDSFQILHDNYGLEPSWAKDLAVSLATNGTNIDLADKVAPAPSPLLNKYNFVPLTMVLIILYMLTYILALQKKITVVTHRRIWNGLLLFAFLASALLGLLLVLRINYGFVVWLPFNSLYWHVEAGIAMAIISFFHVAWHWRYYASMLKRTNNKTS